MDLNKLIDEWYHKFIRAATIWAKSDSSASEIEARTFINCILDLAIEIRQPNRGNLIDELWAVMGVMD